MIIGVIRNRLAISVHFLITHKLLMKTIAFFDLDKTVLSLNSASLWVDSQRKQGLISFSELLRAAFWLFIYHLGFFNLNSMLEKGITRLRGRNAKQLELEMRSFFDTCLKAHIREKAVEQIKWHQDNGHLAVLLTSSAEGISKRAMEVLPILSMKLLLIVARDTRSPDKFKATALFNIKSA